MPQSAKIPNSLQASIDAINNTIVIDPASTIKLAPGTAKAGKFEALTPVWGNVIYEDISINIPANTAANTWINSAFNQNKNGIKELILVPNVKVAASAANTILEIAFFWMGDGSDATKTWVMEESLGVASGGYVAKAQNIVMWNIPISTTGFKDKFSILIPCLGDMFGFQGRINITTTTSASIAFNTYCR